MKKILGWTAVSFIFALVCCLLIVESSESSAEATVSPRDMVTATDEQWEAMRTFRALIHGYEVKPDDPALQYAFMLGHAIPEEEGWVYGSIADSIRECAHDEVLCYFSVSLTLQPLAEFETTAEKLCSTLRVSEGALDHKSARVGLVYTDKSQVGDLPCFCLPVMYFDARLYERYSRYDTAVPYARLRGKGGAESCIREN
ncbi:MAG: hypothetical protein NXH85_02680 [Pseudomonadaceae bacterium]|nr:hypothetical protein [Pseudomonadaceae bacterium]